MNKTINKSIKRVKSILADLRKLNRGEHYIKESEVRKLEKSIKDLENMANNISVDDSDYR